MYRTKYKEYTTIKLSVSASRSNTTKSVKIFGRIEIIINLIITWGSNIFDHTPRDRIKMPINTIHRCLTRCAVNFMLRRSVSPSRTYSNYRIRGCKLYTLFVSAWSVSSWWRVRITQAIISAWSVSCWWRVRITQAIDARCFRRSTSRRLATLSHHDTTIYIRYTYHSYPDILH